MDNSAIIKAVIAHNHDDHPNIEVSQKNGQEETRYRQDSRKYLALLPAEVWDYICQFLDSKSFHNLTNSSLFFRELLLQKRTVFLYKPVLESVLPYLKGHSEITFFEYFQHQADQKNIRSLLVNSREVCKTWKRTIDHKASTLDIKEPRDKNLVHDLLSKNYTFMDSQTIHRFLQHFQATHPSNVNPFPGKYVYLHIRLMEPDYPQFVNRISILLERYGQHIWTFEARIAFGHENPTELHHKIVEWLNCMPNLQNLLIYCVFPLEQPHNVQVDFLPLELRSLRKLALETYCPTIPDNWIPDWSWLDRYNLRKLVNQHDNLDYLKLTMLNKSDAVTLEAINSPLNTLILEYLCKENDVNLSEIFMVLSEKFSNTLENLSITYHVSNKSSWYMKIMKDSFNCRLNLPRLRKIEVDVVCKFSLDFLLGMRESLEELIVNCATLDGYDYNDFSEEEKEEIGFIERNQVITFLGYQHRMLESNIWTMFPKLQKITLIPSIDGSFIRREDWVRIQEQQL